MRTFTLALILVGCSGNTDEPSTDTDEATDTGTADSGDSQYPQVSGGDSATAQFGLEFVELVDADEDGHWEVGETATLFVNMSNTGEDDFNYPGCELFSEDLATGTGEFSFFGLGADQTERCSWQVEHLASAVAFDVIEMRVIADRLNCDTDCPEENSLLLAFELAPAN